MKILILSFYYKPDLCAGSFRCTALVDELKKKRDCEIDVVTTLPNRYASFSADALQYERLDNVTIHRIPLPSHKSGMLDQVKSFFSYYRGVTELTAHKDYDLVFATSSRLFTAFLGARISNKKKVPLYLDIRDIFVDTIKDVLSPKLAVLVKPIFTLVEKYTFRTANRINLVSKGFESYFSKRYPHADYQWFTNGIDKEFINCSKNNDCDRPTGRKLQLLYAGNLGEGQGLHNITPNLAKALADRFDIKIVGDGGRKHQLETALQEQSNENVVLNKPVNRSELIALYQQADVLFLHLNDYPAFKKVLPSKIFEYAAMGKPILAGVSGYAAEFIKSEVPNATVFSPGNHIDALDALSKLELINVNRTDFIDKYSRSTIMSNMAADIIEYATAHSAVVAHKER